MKKILKELKLLSNQVFNQYDITQNFIICGIILQTSENTFLCIKDQIKFELELTNFPTQLFQNLHILKFIKISGKIRSYNKFLAELIDILNKNIKNR